ncbi:MAG: epoxyqueuosine reductase [Chloroflexota bacterium]|nr:epoxyqueuosine reductase [Chloroflexota bacterium]
MASGRGAQIIEKAQEMGAAAAGIASVEALRESPSHEILGKFGTKIDGVRSYVGMIEGFNEIQWPPKAKSALAIAVSHPEDKLELDWTDASGNTPGNRILQRINRELAAWIQETLNIKTHQMPYWVEKGGIYLKDTAVLAGLGCIGRNNMLVTPELGPRVRLRGMLLEEELTPTGPIAFDPCDGCEEFCRKACPQNAFDRVVLSPVDTGKSTLPGRDGFFSRARCSIQMDKDVEDSDMAVGEGFLTGLDQSGVATKGVSETEKRIRWCRRCERACPVPRLTETQGARR